MTPLTTLIATAHRAAALAFDLGKYAPGTLERAHLPAAIAERDAAYRAVRDALAALGQPCGEDDVSVWVAAYALAMRGDVMGAAERFGRMVAGVEADEGKVAA